MLHIKQPSIATTNAKELDSLPHLCQSLALDKQVVMHTSGVDNTNRVWRRGQVPTWEVIETYHICIDVIMSNVGWFVGIAISLIGVGVWDKGLFVHVSNKWKDTAGIEPIFTGTSTRKINLTVINDATNIFHYLATGFNIIVGERIACSILNARKITGEPQPISQEVGIQSMPKCVDVVKGGMALLVEGKFIDRLVNGSDPSA